MTDLVRSLVRDVPDFPKKGIVFKDITPVLAHPKAFQEIVDAFAARYRGKVDKIVAIESRGFLFGAGLAERLSTSLVLVRKLSAVHAFEVAMSGVCGPAKRSRNNTCVIPMRSTTATATW